MHLLAVQSLVGIIDQAKFVVDANQKLKKNVWDQQIRWGNYPSLAQEKPSLEQKGRDNLCQENLKYLVK